MAQRHMPGEGAGGVRGAAAEPLARCAELEAAVEALKVRFEQYFLGLQRMPPNEEHAQLRSAILRLRSAHVRNTAVRFRIQSLHNKLLSYERMWQRTCREIEEGTYRRDLAKVRRRRGGAPGDAALRKALDAGDDDFEVIEDDQPASPGVHAEGARSVVRDAAPDRAFTGSGTSADPEAGPRGSEQGGTGAVAPGVARTDAPSGPTVVGGNARRGAAAAAGGARTQRESSASAAGGAPLPDERLRAVYEAYIGAKKRCRESTEGLSFEAVSSALRKQVPALLEKHKAASVEFKVVIKDGKAILKAVPR